MYDINKITGLDKYREAADPNRGGLGAFNAFFGNTADKFAQGRKLENGKIEANWKDRLFGHSTEELTEEYMKDRAEALQSMQAVKDLQAEGQEIKVTDDTGVIRKKSRELADLSEAHKFARQYGYNLKNIKDPDAVYQKVSDLRKAEVNREDKKIFDRDREETIRQENRLDAQTAQQRLDNLENQQNLYNLKRDELDFQRAQAMRSDQRLAQDRKDKAIAILMSGLGNLGEAFAGMTV